MSFKGVSVGVQQLRRVINETEYSTEMWCKNLNVSKATFYKILKGEQMPSPALQLHLNIMLGLVNDWLPCDAQYEDEENLARRKM